MNDDSFYKLFQLEGSLQIYIENMQSSDVQHARSDRFVEIQTASLPAEWSVSDSHVIKKSHNYRQYLMKTWIKIKYLDIIEAVYVHYIQYDIKSAIKDDTKFQNINKLFLEAFEKNDVTKVILAYTLDGPFFRLLNHHLAIIICADNVEQMKMRKTVKMHYWEGPLDIATIFVCHPDLERFCFKQGSVFRGMCIEKEEDLIPYRTIGNRFLNKTFVSTSKNPEVAKMFSGIDANTQPSKISCLFRYTIVESVRRTALDIYSLSNFSYEEEVLILPYATFEVISYEPSSSISNLIEIELRECEPE